jgi:hypothetical protein
MRYLKHKSRAQTIHLTDPTAGQPSRGFGRAVEAYRLDSRTTREPTTVPALIERGRHDGE